MTPSITISYTQGLYSIFDRSVDKPAWRLGNLWADDLVPAISIALDEPRFQGREALRIAFEEANEPNWDGEDAAPAHPLSYEYAKAFLAAFPPTIPIPDVYVDSDGELCLEWDDGPRSVFSVSIGPDGTLTYAGLFGANKSHGVETFTESIPYSIETNILRAWAST